MFRQYIPLTPALKGKTVTLAARVKGDYVRLNINNTTTSSYHKDGSTWTTLVKTGVLPTDGESFFVALQNQKDENTQGFMCEWIALYEGEYTVDTIPEYQPKGYGAELAEC